MLESNYGRRLLGQVALVTGAGRGIGAAIATALADEGATTILVARTADQLRETERAIHDRGGEAVAHAVDITDQDTVELLVGSVLERFGHVDIVVNNAGIVRHGSVEELSVADFDDSWAVNVRAPFLLMRSIVPAMVARRSGTIVNIASDLGYKTVARRGAYVATKHALIALAECVQREHREDGIRIGVICPGLVVTGILGRELTPEECEMWLRPEDVGRAVVYMCCQPSYARIDRLVLHPMVQDL